MSECVGYAFYRRLSLIPNAGSEHYGRACRQYGRQRFNENQETNCSIQSVRPPLFCRFSPDHTPIDALAKFFVYSMSLDGPIRGETGTTPAADGVTTPQAGYLAGSRALDSLDKLITSTESYFHPSNSGHWTLAVSMCSSPVSLILILILWQLTSFIQRLAAEFCKRWKEEQQPGCRTPVVSIRTVGSLVYTHRLNRHVVSHLQSDGHSL